MSEIFREYAALKYLKTLSLLNVNTPLCQVGIRATKSNFRKEYLMDYEIKNIEMEKEFKICPSCGYEDGFHSMFKKEGSITEWLFICPSCHDIFNIGLKVQ